ncbi:catalase family protein [Sphingomonas crocodyli]|uniref:catalase n=1 Tax=Sphingomonas crocodyli TaxID=1979270 RepID=A0A437LYM4_9SPHN|nr:catalase family protein [Sphingomonas crocodyli]RVT90482.1 catalase [Sphingomonas crocodyli]
MSEPVRFTSDVEQIEPDEAQTIASLEEQFGKILDTTSADYGHAVRSVHAKGHGLARGTLEIADGLPPELAQGLFARAGRYDAILRFSTNAGDILDDAVRLPRGVAVKILNVEGDRLAGSEGDATQDFIMVNGPAFAASDPKQFLGNLKMLAATTDKAEGAKKALSSILRAFEAGAEALGGSSTLLNSLGGAKPVHPLGATYFSQTPYRYGDYIAKFQLAPLAPLSDLADVVIDATDRPDAIRQDMNRELIAQGARWELRVQLCTDLETMPIEDPSIIWDEEASPYRSVATLIVDPQQAWIPGESEALEDKLSFSPWHGLAAHQPLGGVNRARRRPYQFSTAYRSRFNGCPIHEPRALAEL